MVSCTSFLGRLVAQSPIKNYELRDGCYVLDEDTYLMYAVIARRAFHGRQEELQCITNAI